MKKARKIIVCLLLMFAISSVFAACERDNNNQNNTDSTQQTGSYNDNSSTQEPSQNGGYNEDEPIFYRLHDDDCHWDYYPETGEILNRVPHDFEVYGNLPTGYNSEKMNWEWTGDTNFICNQCGAKKIFLSDDKKLDDPKAFIEQAQAVYNAIDINYITVGIYGNNHKYYYDSDLGFWYDLSGISSGSLNLEHATVDFLANLDLNEMVGSYRDLTVYKLDDFYLLTAGKEYEEEWYMLFNYELAFDFDYNLIGINYSDFYGGVGYGETYGNLSIEHVEENDKRISAEAAYAKELYARSEKWTEVYELALSDYDFTDCSVMHKKYNGTFIDSTTYRYRIADDCRTLEILNSGDNQDDLLYYLVENKNECKYTLDGSGEINTTQDRNFLEGYFSGFDDIKSLFFSQKDKLKITEIYYTDSGTYADAEGKNVSIRLEFTTEDTTYYLKVYDGKYNNSTRVGLELQIKPIIPEYSGDYSIYETIGTYYTFHYYVFTPEWDKDYYDKNETYIALHDHNFSYDYSYDDEYHWKESDCKHNIKGDLGEHEWSEWETITMACHDHDGVEKRVCQVCGLEQWRETHHEHELNWVWSDYISVGSVSYATKMAHCDITGEDVVLDVMVTPYETDKTTVLSTIAVNPRSDCGTFVTTTYNYAFINSNNVKLYIKDQTDDEVFTNAYQSYVVDENKINYWEEQGYTITYRALRERANTDIAAFGIMLTKNNANTIIIYFSRSGLITYKAVGVDVQARKGTLTNIYFFESADQIPEEFKAYPVA